VIDEKLQSKMIGPATAECLKRFHEEESRVRRFVMQRLKIDQLKQEQIEAAAKLQATQKVVEVQEREQKILENQMRLNDEANKARMKNLEEQSRRLQIELADARARARSARRRPNFLSSLIPFAFSVVTSMLGVPLPPAPI